MVCWGCFTIAHAYVNSDGMLIALRLMIGLFEAGYFPTSAFFLTSCYTRFDLAFRVAIFYVSWSI